MPIIMWVLIGIIAAGMLFVLTVGVMARISDLRMQRMVRDMQEEQNATLRGTKCGHM